MGRSGFIRYLIFLLPVLPIIGSDDIKRDIVCQSLTRKLQNARDRESTTGSIPGGGVNIVILFADYPISFVIDRFPTRSGNGPKMSAFQKTELHKALVSFTQRIQSPIIKVIQQFGKKYISFWITNEIFVEGATEELVEAISDSPDSTVVSKIREALLVIRSPLIVHDGGNEPETTSAANKVWDLAVKLPFMVQETCEHKLINCSVAWGVRKVNADKAWIIANGKGVVVGHIDSGVRGTHEALRKNRRSTHSWLAPYPYNYSSVPYDADEEFYHGTFTLGIITGTNGIGVAPGAEWISCIGCPNFCPEEALLQCGQFMACPTLSDGSSPDCSMSPDVVNNSWESTMDDVGFYDDVIKIWRIFGIIPVFANGNFGPNCNTTASPGGMNNVISVGATMQNDSIAWFSSKGPSWWSEPRGRIKPDVSAPGYHIPSSYGANDTAYVSNYSGTSFATPHVTGAIAIMLSKNPRLTFVEIKRKLQSGAHQPKDIYVTCGSQDPDSKVVDGWPNNIYGSGRIDVLKSLFTPKWGWSSK